MDDERLGCRLRRSGDDDDGGGSSEKMSDRLADTRAEFGLTKATSGVRRCARQVARQRSMS